MLHENMVLRFLNTVLNVLTFENNEITKKKKKKKKKKKTPVYRFE